MVGTATGALASSSTMVIAISAGTQQQAGELSFLEQRITEMCDSGNEERVFFLRGFPQSAPALKRCHSIRSSTPR
jgi:hypothetical protein